LLSKNLKIRIYRTIILPAVLYGCETWSLTLREKVWERGEAYTGFWWRNMRESDLLGEPGIDGRIILRWIFRKWDVGVWTRSSWLRTGTGVGHL
jgi:hypothetical protein